jgi:hypothetical protein
MGADDMKAIVERLQADLIGQRALGLGDRAVRDDDIRALLKAYQEQRRALEAASAVVPVGREEITAILESYIGASAWSDDADAEVHGIPEAADAILAALRPTDTGRE